MFEKFTHSLFKYTSRIFTASLVLLSICTAASVADPLDVFQDCEECPEMIELPEGRFLMGAPPDEFRRNAHFTLEGMVRATPENPYVKTDEGPQHWVTVDIPIAMGKNEITRREWLTCVEDGG